MAAMMSVKESLEADRLSTGVVPPGWFLGVVCGEGLVEFKDLCGGHLQGYLADRKLPPPQNHHRTPPGSP